MSRGVLLNFVERGMRQAILWGTEMDRMDKMDVIDGVVIRVQDARVRNRRREAAVRKKIKRAGEMPALPNMNAGKMPAVPKERDLR